MSKKSKSNESIEKPEILSDREFDKIKSDLSKELKKLKPRKPSLPTQKRLKSMPEKKAKGVLDDTKQMYKDQIELKMLQKTDRELAQTNIPQQSATTQPKVIQAEPMKQAPVGGVFKGVSPRDLKGIDDSILEKYIRMKILEQKPDYAPFLNANTNKTGLGDIKGIIDIVKLLVDSGDKSPREQGEKDSILNFMLEQQKQNAVMQKQNTEIQMQMLEKIYDDKEQRYMAKIEELELRANVNPFEYLANKKTEFESLKGLLGNASPISPETTVKLEELKADNKLKKMEFQERMAEKKATVNKASEFTGLITEGMKALTESVSKAVGAAVGQIGKQQLDNSDLPSFVPLEQIEQQGSIPNPFPIVNPLPQNPQQRTNKKKYGGGFQVSQTR